MGNCCCNAVKNDCYHSILDTIFLYSNQIIKNDQDKYEITEDLLVDLKRFVNQQVKPLNDYLENNQRKIVEVTKIIEHETRTDNPIKNLLALNT